MDTSSDKAGPRNSPAGLLADRTIVIVGAGPGFGRTLALEAASLGAHVVVGARSADRVEQLAEEIRSTGAQATAATIDVTDADSVEHFARTVAEHSDAVHGLVFSAFSNPSMKPLAQTEHQHVLDSMDLSVLGALRTVQAFTPQLEAGSGSVVLMASAVIHHSRERYASYKVAKSAMVALGQSLATELGPRGIRINSVAPGYIYGTTLKGYFEHLANKYGGTIEDVYQHTAEKLDLRRLPDEAEIARPVVFLLSDMASAVTGQTLTVDCGEFHK